MESVTETLREALESMKKKDSPQLKEMKRCAGRAKTRLFQAKRTELRIYYAKECAKAGVSIGTPGSVIPKGQPVGKERYKITSKAYGNAQNKIRQEFYDLYLVFYNEELENSGIKDTKPYWSSTDLIKKLQGEVFRLETLLATCKCEGKG
jgi:hypothetical protein